MFTIKWVAKNGSEHLWQGSDIAFTPAEENQELPGRATLAFNLGPDTGYSRCTVDSGRVYVMNENGKTVADYAFDR